MSSPLVSIERISFAFPGQEPLFVDASATITAGWTGIVGANGAGKSTLMSLVAGLRSPGAGAIRLEPRDAIVHFCTQSVECIEPAIESLAWEWSADAMRIKDLLSLDLAQLERWATLSPGERKRWQIGAALAARPDVLLVDEPTNHLDVAGQAVLAEALSAFGGVGLLVCHNEAFLERLTTVTVRVSDQTLTQYPMAFGAARAQWLSDEAGHREAWDAADAERRKLERRLADSRRDRAAAEGLISTRSRLKGPKDSDARSMAAKGRAQKGEARLARKVTLTRAAAERASERVASMHLKRRVGRAIDLPAAPGAPRRLIDYRADAVAVGGRTLLEHVSLWLDRGDRVRLEGPNGCGKSTLIRRMLDASALPTDRVLVARQEVSTEESLARLEALHALPPDQRGRVLQLVAALGVEPARLLRTARPSPGEARKLLIAMGLGTGAWLVVLDEPTNHLDLPAIERLEDALQRFEGAVLLVSHDDAFASRVCRTSWVCADGQVRIEELTTTAA